MKKGNAQQLEKLKVQREKINARIQKMESLHKTRQRKEETRRKILIGSYFLEEALKNNTFDGIKQKMNEFLKRNSDRSLFNLPLMEEHQN